MNLGHLFRKQVGRFHHQSRELSLANRVDHMLPVPKVDGFRKVAISGFWESNPRSPDLVLA